MNVGVRLDHLAVAVRDLDAAAERFAALGFEVGPVEEVERERVILRKVRKHGLCIELLGASDGVESGVGRFLKERGEGLHHVALECEDLPNDLKKIEASGIRVLPNYPAVGSEGSKVAFLHPQDTVGLLTELVMHS